MLLNNKKKNLLSFADIFIMKEYFNSITSYLSIGNSIKFISLFTNVENGKTKLNERLNNWIIVAHCVVIQIAIKEANKKKTQS